MAEPGVAEGQGAAVGTAYLQHTRAIKSGEEAIIYHLAQGLGTAAPLEGFQGILGCCGFENHGYRQT